MATAASAAGSDQAQSPRYIRAAVARMQPTKKPTTRQMLNARPALPKWRIHPHTGDQLACITIFPFYVRDLTTTLSLNSEYWAEWGSEDVQGVCGLFSTSHLRPASAEPHGLGVVPASHGSDSEG